MTTDTKPIARRTRILDAAEKLFAQHGFDGVTLRQIAKEAEVDLALPNYYFGPKRDLFDAVFNRRSQILNDIRISDLEACIEQATPNPPSVRGIIKAYLRPLLIGQDMSDEGWRNYYALVAYVNNSRDWGGILMSEFFDTMVYRFMEALRMALPDADDADLYWCYHCLSGALTLTFAQTGRLDKLSNGLCKSTDLEAAYQRMVDFVTAGIERVCKDKA